MKFTVALHGGGHADYIEQYAPAVASRLDEYIGHVVPLRIGRGDLAVAAVLELVETGADDYVRLTFDLLDSDLRWEALVQREVNSLQP